MRRIHVVETATRTAGLAVPAENGLRFHASDLAFATLENRRYARLEDIRADVKRLADARGTNATVGGGGGRRGRKRSSNRPSFTR